MANPNKTQQITELLQHNKDKLLRYLGDFHTDKGQPFTCLYGALPCCSAGTVGHFMRTLIVM